jgi:hypothetical protein
MGTIAADTGYGRKNKEAYISIGITPSITDIGGALQLFAGNILFSATDSYTETKVERSYTTPVQPGIIK